MNSGFLERKIKRYAVDDTKERAQKARQLASKSHLEKKKKSIRLVPVHPLAMGEQRSYSTVKKSKPIQDHSAIFHITELDTQLPTQATSKILASMNETVNAD